MPAANIDYSSIPELGYIPMPESFQYMTVLRHGRPRHEKYSDFWRKHPPMDVRRRAKIFAPFDALKGFGDHIASKEVEYETRRSLSEEERDELDRKLSLICKMVSSRRRLGYKTGMSHSMGQDMSRVVDREDRFVAAQPMVTITYFTACSDPFNDAYRREGQYETVTGTVQRLDVVNTRMITVDDRVIDLEDVADIEVL